MKNKYSFNEDIDKYKVSFIMAVLFCVFNFLIVLARELMIKPKIIVFLGFMLGSFMASLILFAVLFYLGKGIQRFIFGVK